MGIAVSHSDLIGFLASALVLGALGMEEDMVSLRIAAIFSNFAFIAYGLELHLTPVWLLHAILLPLNSWRLVQVWLFEPQDMPFGWGRVRQLVLK